MLLSLGFSMIVTAKYDQSTKAVCGFGILIVGTITYCLAASYKQDFDNVYGVKQYITDPSAYQVDSISINGIFDHIEVKKL